LIDHEADQAIEVVEQEVVGTSITFEKRYLPLESRRICAGWMQNAEAEVGNSCRAVWRGLYVTNGVWDGILPEMIVNGAREPLCNFLLAAAMFLVIAPVRLLTRPGASG
jgi:hypothetical protein